MCSPLWPISRLFAWLVVTRACGSLGPPPVFGPQADSVDIAYPPLVQSGGDYDLRLAAGTSKDTHIHYGVIVCHLGARWAGPPGIACKLPRVPRCSVVRAAVPPA